MELQHSNPSVDRLKRIEDYDWDGSFEFGCFSVVITDIIGTIAVDGYNPVSQTISSLAITDKAWIQDSGLDLFGLSFAACAAGFFYMNLGGWKWKVGTFFLLLLAVDIVLIAEHNKYAGREGVGAAIHIYCVGVLGVLFMLAPWWLAYGLQKIDPRWYRASLGCAIAWTILSPLFFFTPNGWDGAYERFISAIMIGWVAGASWLLAQVGRGQLRTDPIQS